MTTHQTDIAECHTIHNYIGGRNEVWTNGMAPPSKNILGRMVLFCEPKVGCMIKTITVCVENFRCWWYSALSTKVVICEYLCVLRSMCASHTLMFLSRSFCLRATKAYELVYGDVSFSLSANLSFYLYRSHSIHRTMVLVMLLRLLLMLLCLFVCSRKLWLYWKICLRIYKQTGYTQLKMCSVSCLLASRIILLPPEKAWHFIRDVRTYI